MGQVKTTSPSNQTQTAQPRTKLTQKPTTTPANKNRKKKREDLVRFNTRMQKSLKEIKWSKIYYRSFKRTQETAYLKLSAAQCEKAIKSLHKTQSLLARTTRFHHVAKNKKHQACQFYKQLQHESFQLRPKHYLRDANETICAN